MTRLNYILFQEKNNQEGILYIYISLIAYEAYTGDYCYSCVKLYINLFGTPFYFS